MEVGEGEGGDRWIPRWMCVVTKKDKIRNEQERGSAKVVPLRKKITEVQK